MEIEEDDGLVGLQASVYMEKPQKDIHSFIGKGKESLSIKNTMWANTVVARGPTTRIVIYTGPKCRAAVDNSSPRSKVGLQYEELIGITKVLFLTSIALAAVLMFLKGFDGPWYVYMFRFVLLFSYLIPISLRFNRDIGNIFYSWQIQRDKSIAGSVARSTIIPEELGRVSYMLSDKTGTLTMDQMLFKKRTKFYSDKTFHEVKMYVANKYREEKKQAKVGGKVRQIQEDKVSEAVAALALCHNVTLVYEVHGTTLAYNVWWRELRTSTRREAHQEETRHGPCHQGRVAGGLPGVLRV